MYHRVDKGKPVTFPRPIALRQNGAQEMRWARLARFRRACDPMTDAMPSAVRRGSHNALRGLCVLRRKKCKMRKLRATRSLCLYCKLDGAILRPRSRSLVRPPSRRRRIIRRRSGVVTRARIDALRKRSGKRETRLAPSDRHSLFIIAPQFLLTCPHLLTLRDSCIEVFV